MSKHQALNCTSISKTKEIVLADNQSEVDFSIKEQVGVTFFIHLISDLRWNPFMKSMIKLNRIKRIKSYCKIVWAQCVNEIEMQQSKQSEHQH